MDFNPPSSADLAMSAADDARGRLNGIEARLRGLEIQLAALHKREGEAFRMLCDVAAQAAETAARLAQLGPDADDKEDAP